MQVRELPLQVSKRIDGGDGREREGAQHAVPFTLSVEAGRATVAGDAKLEERLVGPAVALVADRGAILWLEDLDTLAQDAVAKAVRRLARGEARRSHARRSAKDGHRGVHFAIVGWVELDEGEIVVGARVCVGLPAGLHSSPGAVGKCAGLASTNDSDRGSLGQRAAAAAVRVGAATRRGAVSRLADVDVMANGVVVDIVGRAAAALRVGVDAWMDCSRGSGGPCGGARLPWCQDFDANWV